MRKEKPIKLGIIKDDKLTKQSDSALWNFDRTLRIFLRDSLRKFAESCDSYPVCFNDNWELMATEEWEKRDKNKDYYKAWVDHLNEITNKLDYSLSDAWEILTEEDNDFLKTYYMKYPSFKSVTNPDTVEKEDIERRNEIWDKVDKEEDKRRAAAKEALDDIKKILFDLWN